MVDGDRGAKKCWFCAHLGKCIVLIPCDKFKEYNYHKKTELTYKEAAKLLGVSLRMFSRLKIKDREGLLKKINKATGKIYIFFQEAGIKNEKLKEVKKGNE